VGESNNNNNEAFAKVYEQLPDYVKDRLSFKNTESYEDWQKRVNPQAVGESNKVKRWNPVGRMVLDHKSGPFEMGPQDESYVLASDFDALQSQLAHLTQQRDGLRDALECAHALRTRAPADSHAVLVRHGWDLGATGATPSEFVDRLTLAALTPAQEAQT
jgi:hypothetical protein